MALTPKLLSEAKAIDEFIEGERRKHKLDLAKKDLEIGAHVRKLKHCRAIMREYNIGHLYPDANPRVERDYQEGRVSVEPDDYTLEMLRNEQGENQALKMENNLLRDYIDGLRAVMEDNGLNSGEPPRVDFNTAQAMLDRFLREEGVPV